MVSAICTGENFATPAGLRPFFHSALKPRLPPRDPPHVGITATVSAWLLSATIWPPGPPYLAVAARTPGRRRCTRCSSSACASRTRSPSGSWAPRRLGPAKSGAAGGSGRSSGSGNCENEEGTHNPCKEKKRKQRFGIRRIPNVRRNRKGIFESGFQVFVRQESSAHWRQSYMITLAHCFGNTKPPSYRVQLIL